MNGFEEGYKFFERNATGVVAAFQSDDYINGINDAIDKLARDINDFQGKNTNSLQLKISLVCLERKR